MRAKYIPATLWALCILLATTNYNFQSLLFAQQIGFNIHLFPNLFDFFILSDIHLESKAYVFQKVGHVISFGILYLLLARAIHNNRKAIFLCILFAFFTEVLQLFFARSGRLSDVVIDSAGIFLAYRLKTFIQMQGGLSSALWKTSQKIFSIFAGEKTR